jgi:hypothetical protein
VSGPGLYGSGTVGSTGVLVIAVFSSGTGGIATRICTRQTAFLTIRRPARRGSTWCTAGSFPVMSDPTIPATRLDQRTVVRQAQGVLMERDEYTARAALAEMHVCAHKLDLDIVTVASAIIASLSLRNAR